MAAEPTPATITSAPILVVQSDADLRTRVCHFIAQSLGLPTVSAADSMIAQSILESSSPQMILTEMGGAAPAFLDHLRDKAPNIPVIILMAAGFESATLRALQRGAAGYASVENLDDELPEILDRVISAAQSTRDRKRLQSSVTRIEMDFELENDAALVPALVAEVQDYLTWMRFLDRPARVRLGVALEEAILNAMIHGNLEISSSLRQHNELEYRNAITERRAARPYADRRIRFIAQLRGDRAVFTIADQGPGFDPLSLPDPTDPANLERVGGRGLLLIRTFMDDVKFNRKGNRITMMKLGTGKMRAVKSPRRKSANS